MTDPVTRPIMVREEVDRKSLRRRNTASSGDSAIVYLTKRGEHFLATARLTASEVWLDTPTAQYTVDTSLHSDAFDLELPSQEEAFSFSANVRVVWRVADPLAAVRTSLREPFQVVRPYLEERLRDITRGFDVESSAAAEREINLRYGDRSIELIQGLAVTRCVVVLVLDQGTREHIAQRTYAERQQEVREREHTAKLDKIRLSKGEGEQTHTLELQAAQHRLELERIHEQHQLELKGQRMKIYAEAMRADDMNLLAMLLAGHGEDVNEVINLVMQQRKMEFDSANAMLNSLLDANLVSRKDVAAIMAKASTVVIDNMRGVSPLGIGAANVVATQPAPAVEEKAKPVFFDDEEDGDDH